MFRRLYSFALAFAVASAVGCLAFAQAPARAGVSDTEQAPSKGILAAAQAVAGHADYDASCGVCHGAGLKGQGDAPALSGRTFSSSWGARSTKDLYAYISAAMPSGAPGSLTEQSYTNIVAYILSVNGAAAGPTAFSRNTDVKVADFALGSSAAATIAPPAGTAPTKAAASSAPAGAVLGDSRSEGAPPGGDASGTPRLPAIPFPFGHTVQGVVNNYVDVTDEMLRNPPDGDWLMYRRNYQGWSFSPLKQVTPANVDHLQLQWSWTMTGGGAQQGTPIVHNGVMFLSNTQNTIQALDARNGELIWENRIGPVVTASYGATRSIAVYKDKVFFATTTAQVVALDARTGKQVWKTEIAAGAGKGNTGGVVVIKGKVITGMMNCDNYSKTNCFISAYDADTGKRDWQFFTVARKGEPGGDTWNGLPNELRAGVDTWIAGTYDPELNTTYWGVAQAKPWFRASRGTGAGSALYSSSTLALDPDTGKLKWYYQHIPGESLDLDEVFERVLIDHGDQKFAYTIGKSGILWKLDRVTGKFRALKQTMFQNVYKKVDEKTGEIVYRDDIVNQKTGQWFGSCPGPQGGHDWPATSYNQPTDLLIIPLSQSCVLIRGNEVDRKLGGGGTAASQQFYFMPGTGENMGKLVAINTATMTEAWSWQQRSPFLTAVLSTGGGVAFIGDFDRYWKALDVKTGKVVWQTRLGQGVQGHPITYAIDGRQYVAVMTGTGGGSPVQKPTAMLGEVNRPLGGTGHEIYVFALPADPSQAQTR